MFHCTWGGVRLRRHSTPISDWLPGHVWPYLSVVLHVCYPKGFGLFTDGSLLFIPRCCPLLSNSYFSWSRRLFGVAWRPRLARNLWLVHGGGRCLTAASLPSWFTPFCSSDSSGWGCVSRHLAIDIIVLVRCLPTLQRFIAVFTKHLSYNRCVPSS